MDKQQEPIIIEDDDDIDEMLFKSFASRQDTSKKDTLVLPPKEQ